MHDVTVVRALHAMLLMSRSSMVVGGVSFCFFIVPCIFLEPFALHWVFVEHDVVRLFGVCARSAWTSCVYYV